jgi:hypothetical protein
MSKSLKKRSYYIEATIILLKAVHFEIKRCMRSGEIPETVNTQEGCEPPPPFLTLHWHSLSLFLKAKREGRGRGVCVCVIRTLIFNVMSHAHTTHTHTRTPRRFRITFFLSQLLAPLLNKTNGCVLAHANQNVAVYFVHIPLHYCW